jgi:hypothetical protein
MAIPPYFGSFSWHFALTLNTFRKNSVNSLSYNLSYNGLE